MGAATQRAGKSLAIRLPKTVVARLGVREGDAEDIAVNVSKWAHSLAVRLPGKIVEALRLEPGASLDILESGDDENEAEEAARRARFLAAMEKIRWPARESYKFDRDEANER